MSTISLVVPTRNPGALGRTLVSALKQQDLDPLELIVVDSGSTDGVVEEFRGIAAEVLSISASEFRHGPTRNFAASAATGSVLVFMTQDAIPLDASSLRTLVEPILRGDAEAAYARQVPRSGAGPLERFTRSYNYPDTSRIITQASVPGLGIRAHFFSNSCSAVRRDVFESLGGFPTHTIMNEDMVFASRLLKRGHRLAYVSEAVIEHSHNYTILQTFRRYFDIGVVFDQASSDLEGTGATREGIKYVSALITWLWRHGRRAWLPVAVIESGTKWAGTFLGKRHKSLPRKVVRFMSMHRAFWHDRQ